MSKQITEEDITWNTIDEENLAKLRNNTESRKFLYREEPYKIGDEIGYVIVQGPHHINDQPVDLTIKAIKKVDFHKLQQDYVVDRENPSSNKIVIIRKRA